MKNYTLNMKTMKRIFFATAIAAVMVACKHTAQTDQTTVTTDTTGLAQYQAWKAQNELNNTTPPQTQVVTTQPQTEVVTTQPKTVTKTRVVHVYEQPRRRSHYTTVTSSSSYTAKKGWSKKAKYGVIGGVTGGVLGAVINKRNRVAGGVIGAVIGGGGGYLLGKHKDKKNGRY